jgi:hypothetical protein
MSGVDHLDALAEHPEYKERRWLFQSDADYGNLHFTCPATTLPVDIHL